MFCFKYLKIFCFYFIFLALICCSVASSNVLEENEKYVFDVVNFLERYHYRKKNITNIHQFISNINFNYVKALNYNNFFITKEDNQILLKPLYHNFEKINEFVEESKNIFSDRLATFSNEVYEAHQQKIDFSLDEKYIFLEDDYFFDSLEELKKNWKQYYKYQILNLILTDEKYDSNSKLSADELNVLEEKYRKKNWQIVKRLLKTFYERDTKKFLDIYLNTVTSYYGPHTTYLNKTDAENFNTHMSGKFEGIGARLTLDDDDAIEVISVFPGGPAYKQGELKAGDKILAVAQEKEENFLDLQGFSLQKSITYIKGPSGTIVRLKVKKGDGNTRIISIKRGIVFIEETYAKSTIISFNSNIQDNDSNSKYGYLNLPSFYLGVGSYSLGQQRSCAIDVLREIEKLQQAGVDKIIFDLRNNGGGSLSDVVKIAGYFIKNGPIVNTYSSDGSFKADIDDDGRTIFDGDLVVLINKFSASASEIFAAAMQDYNRAIIVGGDRSFGKGTVQNKIPIAFQLPLAKKINRKEDEIKWTIKKFYRINGGTTQHEGVIPDIRLPMPESALEIGESEYPNALLWNEVPPLTYDTWGDNLYKKNIVERSSLRTASNSYFITMDERNQYIKKNQNDKEITLNYLTFSKEKDKQKSQMDIFEKKLNSYKQVPIYFDEKYNLKSLRLKSKNSTELNDRKEIQKKWYANLKKDTYLQEALFILNDISELRNKE